MRARPLLPGRTPRLLLALVTIVAIACTPGDDNANGGLANTSWTVLSISGQATQPEAQPTMIFAPEGTVSGSAGCNQYSGSFRTDGNAISVGQLASTMMLCEGNVGGQEGAFLAGLQGASTWVLREDGNLQIGGAGDIVARPGAAGGPPAAPPADGAIDDPAGTAWTLTDMGGTADFARLVLTLEFNDDGTVSGFSGCNTFTGPVQVSGGHIRLGPLATTRIGCAGPASAVEAEYLGALAGVDSWFVDEAGQLALGGTVPLLFARS